jgi:cytochrome c peroxidase
MSQDMFFGQHDVFPRGDWKAGNSSPPPTLIPRAWGKWQFWDGRAPTLETQFAIPVTNPDEIGMTTEGVVQKVCSLKVYWPFFAAAFSDDAVIFDRIAKGRTEPGLRLAHPTA